MLTPRTEGASPRGCRFKSAGIVRWVDEMIRLADAPATLHPAAAHQDRAAPALERPPRAVADCPCASRRLVSARLAACPPDTECPGRTRGDARPTIGGARRH